MLEEGFHTLINGGLFSSSTNVGHRAVTNGIGVKHRACASEEAKPRRGWTQGSMLARTMGPEGMWIGGWIGSHIDWRRERVSARMLGPKGGWIVRPTSVGEENETFYKGVETSP